MNVVLTGMKHCGKSSCGRALAAYWRCAFSDTDELVVQRHTEATGESLSVREYCQRYGDAAFESVETEVLVELYRQTKGAVARHVVALGGRALTHANVYPIVEALGTIVFLKVDPNVLFERVMRGGRPPFLSPERPFEDFMRVYREREPYYECCADVMVEPGAALPDEVAQIVAERVEELINAR